MKTTEDPDKIEFFPCGETIMEFTKDKFIYKGEEIDDVHEVYRRIHEWLAMLGIK